MSDDKGIKKRKRRPKPGDTAHLRRTLWYAIREVENVIESVTDVDTKLKAVSALSTAAGVYLRVIETHAFEKRLDTMQIELRSLHHEFDEARKTPLATRVAN